MNNILDFSNCKRVHTYYGGSDRKFGVLYNNEVYMLKFSENHSKRSDISTSYVNNVVSEYISSHISASIGLPTHDTLLGLYKDEIVVACKDFRQNQSIQNVEFAEYIRSKYDSKEVKRLIKLNQIYETLKDPENDIPLELQEASVERFWDTFVVDALVGNFDRHVGNWGYLVEGNNIKLAPIYDYGSTLFPQLSDEGMESIMTNDFEIAKRCLVFPSPSLAITDEKVGKVGYYDMLSSNYDKNCTKAVLKIVPKIDMNKITDIIKNTPLITNTKKSFYTTILNARKELIIDRAYLRCFNHNYDKDALNRLQTGKQFSEKDLTQYFKEREVAKVNFKNNKLSLEKMQSIDFIMENIKNPLQYQKDISVLQAKQLQLSEQFGFNVSDILKKSTYQKQSLTVDDIEK